MSRLLAGNAVKDFDFGTSLSSPEMTSFDTPSSEAVVFPVCCLFFRAVIGVVIFGLDADFLAVLFLEDLLDAMLLLTVRRRLLIDESSLLTVSLS